MKIVFIAILVLLAACTVTEPQRASAPFVPPAEPISIQESSAIESASTPTAQQAQPANAIRDAMFFGTRKDGGKAIDANDVLCDLDENVLVFRFRNTDVRSWQLDNNVPLASPQDIVGARILINQYHANTRTYFMDGKKLFGPGELFSDGCTTDVAVPGEDVTCIVTDVPLRPIERAGGVNEIIINVPGAAEDPRVEFTCGKRI